MNRRFGWALCIAVGMTLGYVLNSLDGTGTALAPQSAHAQMRGDDTADQIKEIQTQVKEINKLLQSGKLHVVVEIYPDAQ